MKRGSSTNCYRSRRGGKRRKGRILRGNVSKSGSGRTPSSAEANSPDPPRAIGYIRRVWGFSD
eukprot:3634912-Amphidinium_carterae.1